MITPFEHMKRKGQSAEKSLRVSYMSLPASIMLFKALKNRHYLLAKVCLVATLSPLLIVATSTLTYERKVDIERDFLMQPSYKSMINVQGRWTADDVLQTTREFQKVNFDVDLLSKPWTDDEWFYAPFMGKVEAGPGDWLYRHDAHALRAVVSCKPHRNEDFIYELAQQDDHMLHRDAFVEIRFSHGQRNITCIQKWKPYEFPIRTDLELSDTREGRVATEFMILLEAKDDMNYFYKEDRNFCQRRIAALWLRAGYNSNSSDAIRDGAWHKDLAMESTAVICALGLEHGFAEITTTESGHVKAKNMISGSKPSGYASIIDWFREDRGLDVQQQFMSLLGSMLVDHSNGRGMQWFHNDSTNGRDFNNRLLIATELGNSHLDPQLAPPPAEKIAPLLEKQLTRLFPATMSVNMKDLLVKATEEDGTAPAGSSSPKRASSWRFLLS